MIKERAILQRIVDGDNRGDFFISYELLTEIEELLVQSDQKPLSVDKLKAIAVEGEFLLFCNEDEFIEIARVIEREHGIGE